MSQRYRENIEANKKRESGRKEWGREWLDLLKHYQYRPFRL